LINNNSDGILDSSVAKAIVMGTRNPFDKKICSNCKFCSSKGEYKYFCGSNRNPVTADGGCYKFDVKPSSTDVIK